MKERKTKTFTMDGRKYRFDHKAFKKAYLFQLGQAKFLKEVKTEADFQERLAEVVCTSTDAIKKWKYGINSPGSVEIISDIERCLKAEPGSFLSEEIVEEIVKENADMTTRMIADYERDAVRRVYQQLVKLITAFSDTEGKQFFEDLPVEIDYTFFMSETEKTYTYHEYMTIEDDTLNVFHDNMIDIPEKIYNDLYHLYMVIIGGFNDDYIYREDCYGDSWYSVYVKDYFQEHYEGQDVCNNNYVSGQCMYELTSGWYQEIRKILVDYIPA